MATVGRPSSVDAFDTEEGLFNGLCDAWGVCLGVRQQRLFNSQSIVRRALGAGMAATGGRSQRNNADGRELLARVVKQTVQCAGGGDFGCL